MLLRVDGETLAGVVNMQKPGVDYTFAGSTVQFLTGATPQTGDILLAWYRLPERERLSGDNKRRGR